MQGMVPVWIREKLLSHYADQYAFIWYNMGVNPFK